MNKQELVQSIATKLEVSQVEAKNILTQVENVIKDGLKDDGEVVFMDSKFKLVGVEAKPEKQGRNPATGEPMTIPAKPSTNKVVFKVGKKLKDEFK